MHIVYCIRGLLNNATEDIIETFDTKKNANENGEDDPEDIYRLANVLSEHSGLETMLKRLDSIHDMSSGKALLQILLKLFEYAIKLKVNRQRLIDPNLRSISSMLNKLNLLLKTETEEQGRNQGLLLLTEKLLFIMDQLFHEASTTLSQDKYNEFSVSCEGDIEQLRSLLNYIKLPFVKTHPSLMEALIHLLPYLSFGNKEKMRTLLDYFKSYLEFDRFDLEQTSSSTTTISNDNDSQLHLDCFCEICKHLDKKSVYGKEFRDLVNESNGIIDQCINYIESNSPQVKTYLGMQDQDSWKEFLNKPSLSYVLRLLTGLSYGHEHIQMKIGQSLIPILHKIEQLTTAGKVGVLAEDLLHSLTENEQVAKKIDDVRNQTRAEKKRLAQEARGRKMRELNLTKIARNKSASESSATASKTPVSHGDLTDETGHVCCICREGYKYFPNKVLAIYTFTKKVDIEPYEAKTRKTSGYATVTHFNIIHIECHTSAIKQARSRDEWESALLQNANTRCNGLLPLWGPDVAEAQFTTALARYDTNIIEATGIRETSPTLSIHDIKLLLLRFADVQSFSEDTGGGGRESNIRLIPYEMHTILNVLTTRPDLLINEAFEVDGPFFLTTLSLIIMKPNDWEKNRRIFLRKLLLTTHIRSVNTSNDRTKIASKALKSFATYKTTLVFFGLVNAFFVHMLNPIYTISDLHVDHDENMKWVEHLLNDKYLNDTVIIAGDVIHVLSELVHTLKLFKSKFKDVYYCPGNHELWTKSLREDEELQIHNSIEKFHYILEICDDIGIHTRPGVTSQGVTIVPLYGWYDDSLHMPVPNVESDLQLWMDYYRCQWTDEVPQREAAKYFVNLNEQHLSSLNKNKSNSKIITFSHFLTSKKLMQAYRSEMSRRRQKWLESQNNTPQNEEITSGTLTANFSLVAGTELLDEQLKLIKPQIHIFGHSHRKMILDIGDGIKYINNPLGYTRERENGLIEPPHELYEINLIEK
ncbi:unnamed protein product [Rotaria sordida]|uniref:E3 ubiquitin ligase UBR4 C-terminal domain-containing protein n=1 Tax=Rotaria sordida TaxID=392033 RepID=A0A815Z113_9BILA|nr:unnamed protein product [Rotaria sordida]CAF1578195.1 unnamed protein product [Rotaria sordida]